jgi:hypothetical protein
MMMVVEATEQAAAAAAVAFWEICAAATEGGSGGRQRCSVTVGIAIYAAVVGLRSLGLRQSSQKERQRVLRFATVKP